MKRLLAIGVFTSALILFIAPVALAQTYPPSPSPSRTVTPTAFTGASSNVPWLFGTAVVLAVVGVTVLLAGWVRSKRFNSGL